MSLHCIHINTVLLVNICKIVIKVNTVEDFSALQEDHTHAQTHNKRFILFYNSGCMVGWFFCLVRCRPVSVKSSNEISLFLCKNRMTTKRERREAQGGGGPIEKEQNNPKENEEFCPVFSPLLLSSMFKSSFDINCFCWSLLLFF